MSSPFIDALRLLPESLRVREAAVVIKCRRALFANKGIIAVMGDPGRIQQRGGLLHKVENAALGGLQTVTCLQQGSSVQAGDGLLQRAMWDPGQAVHGAGRSV